MAAGSTYTPIATQTLGSAQASVTFSSISGSYTDLVLIIAGTTSAGSTVHCRFNSDSGNNYSLTTLSGDGSTAVSGSGSNVSDFPPGVMSTNQGNVVMQFQNYSNNTTYKTILARYNVAIVYGTGARVGLWRNTNAINSINIFLDGAETFSSGSIFTLYGIAAA